MLVTLCRLGIPITKRHFTMATERQWQVVENLKEVQAQVAQTLGGQKARLVAVSKYKPAEDLMYCYDAGQRHFGENYVQELVDKSEKLPRDIQWHFIGHLQSNKCKAVAGIPNLFAVETVDSIKKADSLNKACVAVGRPEPLRVFVQINTSREENKSGTNPSDSTIVCKHIVEHCPQLALQGLMTIGMFGREPSEKNPDFECLVDCKKTVEAEMPGRTLELSMGMSDDFVQALEAGSTNVRVGSKIFGARKK
ncbi:alanine racemase [Phycomyces nitens]|nr:alanine racemase [Phycomyces nitens]